MHEDLLPVLRSFELNADPERRYDEEEVLALLRERIAWLMAHRMELLFSLMYRMDIDEAEVRRVLHPESDIPPAEGLARLVLHRQRNRFRTRKDTPVPEIDPDLAW
jgi:hypothetical protein